MKPAAPPVSNVFLHVTNACNLRCKYCYACAGKPEEAELTSAEMLRLWPEMRALRPGKVVFTGGEPLLRADILILLAGLREADPGHEIKRCLNTNGWLITERLASQFAGLVDELRVSIDALAKRNDALRGAGSFEAAVSALDLCRRVGFEPRAMVTITPHSLPDLEELVCFLVGRKITRISFNVVRPIGRGANYEGGEVDLPAAQAAVRQARVRCLPNQPASLQIPRSGCRLGDFMNIMPNGDVYPCHMLARRRFLAGNVREKSLPELGRRIRALKKPDEVARALSADPTGAEGCPVLPIAGSTAARGILATS